MIPPDGRFAAFHDDEHRFAVGVAQTAQDLLAFMVGDTTGHPFDGSPIAVLHRSAVERLRDALSAWLTEPDAREQLEAAQEARLAEPDAVTARERWNAAAGEGSQ